jgi:mRNA-degrading endonuclease YafQ of YafQ-DinJ toxin-antitoxin module
MEESIADIRAGHHLVARKDLKQQRQMHALLPTYKGLRQTGVAKAVLLNY